MSMGPLIYSSQGYLHKLLTLHEHEHNKHREPSDYEQMTPLNASSSYDPVQSNLQEKQR